MPENENAKQNETKTILVVSDTHGDVLGLRKVLAAEPQACAVFFLGDGSRDVDKALAAEKRQNEDAGARRPVYLVAGNCDYDSPDPTEGLVPVGGVLFFYTHGHHYNVKWSTDTLCDTALVRGADVALYGHTHRQELLNAATPTLPTLFNPGSLREGSYGVITVENGNCHFTWKKVPRC